MRIVKYVAPAALVLGLVVGLALVRADDTPKYSIKDVMKMAHKAPEKDAPSLYKKVVDGNGSKDDKDKLVELYTALAANHPKVNDDDDWKTRTQAMLAAAKDIQGGKDAADSLKKAAACGDCHKNHRPPTP